MITIQPITTIEQCQQIGEIEKAAWGGKEPVPDHILLAIAHHKGVALLAYDRDLPIGFCVSFVSFVGMDAAHTTFCLKHHSHMTGVLPAYQGQGIARQLKWAQREYVLKQQIDHITWTFDPLEARNGRLNIHKLGAMCCRYLCNVYGLMNDGLNAGIFSDRFEVDWWLQSAHVVQHQAGTYQYHTRKDWQQMGVRVINSVEMRDQPRPHTVDATSFTSETRLLVAIPSNYQAVKRADLANSIAWRMHTRNIFETAFAHGFTVTDLIYEPQLSYYLLERIGNGRHN